jgi:interferon-induced GTP-binding protein Mx1
MGDTSSGKSSVLSAISKIEFPSNDKLTTRCPMRLRMERKEKSSAKVYIKWHKDSNYKKTFDPIEIIDQTQIANAIHKA